MRFDRLDLNLLVAFDVLIETCNVSEAARRLSLSQPAVTGALNRLREFFEDDLLVQSGRRMLPTRKAEELAGPVRRTLMMVRAEITSPGRFDPATAVRRFLVAASDYAYTVALADVIVEAARQAPGVTFEIIQPGSQAVERFERAEIDLFMTVEPFAIPNHPQMKLWQDSEVVISWSEAGYPDRIDLKTFFDAGHAVVLFGPDRRASLMDVYLEKLGHDRRIEVLLPHFSALPQAVVGTGRLAAMHRLFAERLVDIYPIRLHEFWQQLPKVPVVLQWHQIRANDIGLIWLRGLVGQHVATLPTALCP